MAWTKARLLKHDFPVHGGCWGVFPTSPRKSDQVADDDDDDDDDEDDDDEDDEDDDDDDDDGDGDDAEVWWLQRNLKGQTT